MDLDTVADELYGLRPEDFTAARQARAAAARESGDRALAERIGRLRRPSLAAWASNLLVRRQPEDVEPLLRLGEALRQAHHDLDGAQLRDLSRRQHVLINALSRQARHLADQAGHPIGDDVQREIEAMLQTVLADPDAGREWATGRLVKPFGPTVGFPAASTDATARRTPPARRPAPPPSTPRRADKAADERRRRLDEARREAEQAEAELRAGRDEAAEADRRIREAEERADALRRRVGELSEELRRLEEEQRQAGTAVREARERARAAERRVREAGRRAKTAAARVERLNRTA
ncbi:hypothetical protein ABZZ74_17835 [Streptomyces sp. NPDC006476]|uniref:hypothetical protein n=1 Tax=Streptomyces sp. NPDC006476 TaxID=3157175 RepID=UPI0033B19F2B